MEILKKAYEIINQKQDEIIGTLQQFIAIPSVSVRTPGDKPFGEDVDRAFKFMLEKAENDGFETFNAEDVYKRQMQKQLLIEYPMEQVVAKYASNAREAGLAGVVCSPLEVPEVKVLCGEEFVTCLLYTSSTEVVCQYR